MPKKGEIINPLLHATKCYGYQKFGAKKRGISFELTFEEWYKWFLDQGVDRNIPQANAGSSWAMCRHNDTGPYKLGNIYLATMSQNSKDKAAPSGSAHPNFHKGQKIQTPAGLMYVDEAAKQYSLTPQGVRWRVKNKAKGFDYAS